MSLRQIEPKQRGFLVVNSHPEGAARTVRDMWQAIPARTDGRRPVALVLGHSAGYGLATVLAGLRRHGIRGIGVAFETPDTGRRTAGAGWYRTAAAAALAAEHGHDIRFVNADAFSADTKTRIADLLEQHYGPVDYLVYSLAAPRRTDPATGEVHHSVIKPLGTAYEAPSLDFSADDPAVAWTRIEPGTDAEARATVAVMGGDDWALWVRALASRRLLADGFTTAALTYVGSEVTAPVYREGTIGAAKEHLERTARELAASAPLKEKDGRAFTVVAGAAVTQASSAIPSIALYTAFLRTALGEGGFRTTSEQAVDLWDQLEGRTPLVLDAEGRIRLDGWELDPRVQDRVRELWADPRRGLDASRSGADWFMGQVRALYGWNVDGVDYGLPAETDVPWPTRR
ncbi:enoyl-[acyl-carrier protein] reductase/trans-2-enoyl-CoA reductase (NAD+) [Streptomyces sp. 3211.6]|uniref:enoyl-[acyl-carrier-protein] reductase FabV n=1 Tax=Streptomyces sp. 3211.6 TaxID=1938845 RepID=UPI000EAD82C3|nr:enoyl-[acyl-carrier-protein] reductase FabV [Streptomyces sp. 3211.6]RKT03584.1 enoyl-[acyl-carrier protein] reductase/trans-2-enoyl-CoA reductase (NAD+) [Streptomyces sp. 3211.6]